MRSAALSILMLIASCAPDYAHGAFRCDLDNGQGCPDGQDCILGRCRRRPPTGTAACGEGSDASCDLTRQQCCVFTSSKPQCQQAGVECPGTLVLCDDHTDCRGTDGSGMDYCCADGKTVFCDASCDHYVCRDNSDCPPAVHNCCEIDLITGGRCSQFDC